MGNDADPVPRFPSRVSEALLKALLQDKIGFKMGAWKLGGVVWEKIADLENVVKDYQHVAGVGVLTTSAQAEDLKSDAAAWGFFDPDVASHDLEEYRRRMNSYVTQ